MCHCEILTEPTQPEINVPITCVLRSPSLSLLRWRIIKLAMKNSRGTSIVKGKVRYRYPQITGHGTRRTRLAPRDY